VIITAYRISKAKYADTIWSGIGAKDYGGRWNSKGVAVIYAAENRSLAAMEQLVHLNPRKLTGYVSSSIAFDEALVTRVDPRKLPSDWANPVAPAALRKIGDAWVAAGKYPVLAVPSAITPGEWNFLINPSHLQFNAMAKSTPMPFQYDPRLG
jgi:RES domain-containing protein